MPAISMVIQIYAYPKKKKKNDRHKRYSFYISWILGFFLK